MPSHRLMAPFFTPFEKFRLCGALLGLCVEKRNISISPLIPLDTAHKAHIVEGQ